MGWQAIHGKIDREIDAGDYSYLLSYCLDAGLCDKTPDRMNGGMIFSPLSWQEIKAWAELTGVKLGRWEARMLRMISCEYVDEVSMRDSKSPKAVTRPDRRAEFVGKADEIMPVSDDAIRAALGL